MESSLTAKLADLADPKCLTGHILHPSYVSHDFFEVFENHWYAGTILACN